MKLQSKPVTLEFSLNRLFFYYGRFVGKYPWQFLVLPLLGAIVAIIYGLNNMVNTEKNSDVREVFISDDTIKKEKLSINSDIYFNMIFWPKNEDQTLIWNSTASRLDVVLSYILSERMKVRYKDSYISFSSLCKESGVQCVEDYTTKIKPVTSILLNSELRKSPQIKINYPVWNIFSETVSLVPSFYAPTFDEQGDLDNFRVIQVLVMVFIDPLVITETKEKFLAFGRHLTEYLHENVTKNEEFQANVIAWYTPTEGLLYNAELAFPKITVSIGLLIIFTVLSSSRPYDCKRSKFWEALAAILSAMMAIGFSFGTLVLYGYTISAVDVIMPFLVLAIGVDDAFIMMQAWHRAKSSDYTERLGIAMSEAATSITITSLTDVISFGVGTLSKTPAIRNFCAFTAVALAFDYVYQITFFMAVLAVGGQREHNGMAPILCCRKSRQIPVKKLPRDDILGRRIFTRYAQFILKPISKCVVMLVFLLTVVTSLYGCSQIKANLSVYRLFVRGTPEHELFKVRQRHILSNGVMVNIFVERPPDFSNFSQINEFYKAINEFENISYSLGPRNRVLWLSDYLEFVKNTPMMSGQSQNSLEHLCNWLKQSTKARWKDYITFAGDECSTDIREFRFELAYGSVSNQHDHIKLMNHWDDVIERYPQFQMSDFHLENSLAQQTATLPQSTSLTLGVAIIALSIVTLLFIPSLVCSLLVVMSMLCIDMGVIGYLALFGCDLDPITAIGILMSIGFAVNFTVHITYRYYRSEVEGGSHEKVIDAVAAMAWPVIQASITTTLGTIGLIMVPSYIVNAFFYTVVIVVGLGMFHSLAVLPVMLTLLSFD